MEDIDGGLHPAVDGQSLDEMKVRQRKQREVVNLKQIIFIS